MHSDGEMKGSQTHNGNVEAVGFFREVLVYWTPGDAASAPDTTRCADLINPGSPLVREIGRPMTVTMLVKMDH